QYNIATIGPSRGSGAIHLACCRKSTLLFAALWHFQATRHPGAANTRSIEPDGYDAITRPCRDHRKAMGPNRTPVASSANNADHPAGCPGPPAASSAMPAPQPPSAERPNPTVECSARVAPRYAGVALAVVPDVSAPESAGMVRP